MRTVLTLGLLGRGFGQVAACVPLHVAPVGQTRVMATWTDIEADAPELAATVRARFEAHGMGLLATLRRDGSPRISGIEPLFALGELWMGMMPGSRKAADVVRDPRFALHSATTDKDVTH